MVVDDEIAICVIVKKILEKVGYEVTTVENSMRAWEMLKVLRPEVIVMDIMMPHMNGWELLEKIRHNPPTKEIPVIMLTALCAHEDKFKSLEKGANYHLKKPIIKGRLLNTIDSILKMPKKEVV